MDTASGSGPSADRGPGRLAGAGAAAAGLAPRIRPLRLTGPGSDLAWAEALLDQAFAGRLQARLGELVDALAESGLVAEDPSGRPVGLVAWAVAAGSSTGGDATRREAEIRVLVVGAAARGTGLGGALLAAAEARFAAAGIRRAWLLTTNDNTTALAFYQRRGWRLAQLLPGAVEGARRLKPSIPMVAENGIPIRDELVLDKRL